MWTFTDQAIANGSQYFQILGGASGTTPEFSVDRLGIVTTPYMTLGQGGTHLRLQTGIYIYSIDNTWDLGLGGAILSLNSSNNITFTGNANRAVSIDANISRTGAGEISIGSGAAGSAAGTMRAAAYKVGATAGASFGPGLPTSLTIVNGIVTAAS